MDLLHLTPSDLQNVVFFLLPGFLFFVFFFYQIPDKKKSDFITIFASVILSVLLNFLTNWIFFAITYITHLKWTIPSNNPGTIWISSLFAILFSILLARILQSENKIFKMINNKIFKVDQYPFGTMWNAFLKMRPDSYVKVVTNLDEMYVGKLGRVSNESDDDTQEIELLKPFLFKKSDNQLVRITETENMMLQGSSIVSIERLTDEKAQELYNI